MPRATLECYVCNECGAEMLNQGIVKSCTFCGSDKMRTQEYSLESGKKNIKSFAEQKKDIEDRFGKS